VGGAGTGETAENLAAAVHGVKTAVGVKIPVLVQGMDSLQEVCTTYDYHSIIFSTYTYIKEFSLVYLYVYIFSYLYVCYSYYTSIKCSFLYN